VKQKVDILVIGGGVAGTTAALELARAGLRVTLVDRSALPRHKVCGCSLNVESVDMLTAMGLKSGLDQAEAQTITTITLCAGKRSVSLSGAGGAALSRYALDAMLAQAAKESGCEVIDNCPVRITQLSKPSQTYVEVICKPRNTHTELSVHASVVLVADGLGGSSLANIESSKRTIKSESLYGYGTRLDPSMHDWPKNEVRMHCGQYGYVGTVVLEDGSLDVAAAMNMQQVKMLGGPAAAVSKLLSKAGAELSNISEVSWRATPPLTGSRKKLWYPRVFVLGDAAGYVEPFTGEGMAWAMRSAREVAPLAIKAVKQWDNSIGYEWASIHRERIKQRQWRCIVAAATLKRPWLTHGIVQALSWFPPKSLRAASKLAMPAMFSHKDMVSRNMETKPA